MERRDALKHTALLIGYGLSASTISAVLAGCGNDQSAHGSSWKPAFFNVVDFEMISQIAEIILPATSTPGARDVGVPEFIDDALFNHHTTDQQQRFLDGLNQVNLHCQEGYKKDFLKCSIVDQNATVAFLEEGLKSYLTQDDIDEDDKPFYPLLKEMVLSGYFTSETIGKEYLSYDPIPTRYDACIPLSDVGNAWSF